MKFGEKLSGLRKQHNYTQEELADVVGVSRQAISKWESDVSYPETEKLILLSKLFGCTVDYLLNEDATDPLPQNNDGKDKALRRWTLNNMPLMLFMIWSLLLWGFFAIPIINGIGKTSLYFLIDSFVMRDLQPTLCLLVCFAALATLYGIFVAVAKRFFGNKIIFALTLGSFGFYAAVFACSMALVGQIWYFESAREPFVTVVSVVTVAFALAQTLFMILRGYFSDTLRPAYKKCVSCIKRAGKWYWAKRAITLTLTFAIAACVVLSIALPVTLCDPFRLNVATSIKFGDSRESVRAKLGEPLDVAAVDSVLKQAGSDFEIGDGADYWCKGKARSYMEEMLRLTEIDQNASSEERTLALIKLLALANYLGKVTTKTYTVSYGDNGVNGVRFDNNARIASPDSVKWQSGGGNQSVELLDKTFADDFSFANTRYKAYYSDGSYALGYVENMQISYYSQNAWYAHWSDDWGSYESTVYRQASSSDSIIGSVGAAIYILTPNNTGYKLTLRGGGAGMSGDIDEYRSQITEVEFVDGLTEIPDGIFEGVDIFESLTLPSSVKRIGKNAFKGCTRLEYIDMFHFEEIDDYAFCGCTSLSEAMFGKELKRVGAHAFEGCASLNEVTSYSFYEEGYELILGEYAFAECKAITSVELDMYDQVEFSAHCFENCTNLTRVSCYLNVIGDYALAGTSIFSLDPMHLESVGYRAFYNSTLKYIYFNYNYIRFVSANAFEGCDSLLIVIDVDAGKAETWILTKDGESVTKVLEPEPNLPDWFLQNYSDYDWEHIIDPSD